MSWSCGRSRMHARLYGFVRLLKLFPPSFSLRGANKECGGCMRNCLLLSCQPARWKHDVCVNEGQLDRSNCVTSTARERECHGSSAGTEGRKDVLSSFNPVRPCHRMKPM